MAATGANKRRVPDSLRVGGSDDEMDEKRPRTDPASEKKSEIDPPASAELETKKDPDDENRLKTTLDLETFKCSICLNIWYDVVCVSPCQHNFCNGCFSEWFKRSQQTGSSCKCPQCRGGIIYACRNHAMASLVDDLLSNNPSLKRPADETEKMDKMAIVTSTFMKLNNPRSITMSNFRANLNNLRPNANIPHPAPIPHYRIHDEDDDDDEGESLHSDDEDSRDGGSADDYESDGGDIADDRSCRQCKQNNSGFHCSPGENHLVCHGCACEMPERSSFTQRCAACRVIFCDAYWRSQNLVSDSGENGCPNDRLLSMSERQISSIPHGAHKSNSVEQEFTKQYLSDKGFTVEDVVRNWMEKVDRSELALPDDLAVTSTSAICNYCSDKVISHLLDKFRMSIPKTEMPPEAARRDDCWYGLACRTQVHNVAHAKKLNHVCEPTARNVIR